MKRNYYAPISVPVQITAENFLMTSNLQDYPDNPIFGAPMLYDYGLTVDL